MRKASSAARFAHAHGTRSTPHVAGHAPAAGRQMQFGRLTSRARPGAATGRLLALLATALLVLLAAGCGSGSSGSTSGSSTTGSTNAVLTIGVQNAPTNLDPSDNTNLGTPIPGQLWAATILQDSAQDGSHGPGLATRFGYVGSGNKVYEMQLRRDARFSDGTPVTSKEVKAWLDYYWHTGNVASALIPIESIEAPDKWTVRITLRRSDSGVPSYLAQAWGWGYVTKVAGKASMSKNPIGAGPYMLVPGETVVGDHFTLKPNPYYYDKGRIHYGKVVVKVIKAPNTMLQAIKSGQLDVAIGDFTTAASAEAAGLNVNFAPLGWTGLHLEDRTGRISKPLGDVRVRQALNYAIDRRAITEAMMGKYAQPSAEVRTLDGFDPAYQDYYPYDVERARQLLADAGYADGFSLDVVDAADQGNVGDPMVQAVAKYLKAVGVRLNITTAATTAEWAEKQGSGKYPAWQHNSPGPGMASWYTATMKKDGPGNRFGWHDPAIDALAAKAASAPQDKVNDYWRAISRKAVEEALFLPVFLTPNIVYSTDNVAGVSVTPWFYYSPVVLEWHPK